MNIFLKMKETTSFKYFILFATEKTIFLLTKLFAHFLYKHKTPTFAKLRLAHGLFKLIIIINSM
jgi:hypothetical protein